MKNLVDKEQAIALKEAGYDAKVNHFYQSDGQMITFRADYGLNFNAEGNCCSAPSLDEAANWLREAKGLHVCVVAFWSIEKWKGIISQYGKNTYCNPYDTYPDALSAAISHALKMIKGL